MHKESLGLGKVFIFSQSWITEQPDRIFNWRWISLSGERSFCCLLGSFLFLRFHLLDNCSFFFFNISLFPQIAFKTLFCLVLVFCSLTTTWSGTRYIPFQNFMYFFILKICTLHHFWKLSAIIFFLIFSLPLPCSFFWTPTLLDRCLECFLFSCLLSSYDFLTLSATFWVFYS